MINSHPAVPGNKLAPPAAIIVTPPTPPGIFLAVINLLFLLGPSMFSLPSVRLRRPSVPATRSGRFIRPRRRSPRSPQASLVKGRWQPAGLTEGFSPCTSYKSPPPAGTPPRRSARTTHTAAVPAHRKATTPVPSAPAGKPSCFSYQKSDILSPLQTPVKI